MSEPLSIRFEDLPDGWEFAGGESNRPVVGGGYYLTVFTRTLWENQFARKYIEARLDTANGSTEGPIEHVLVVEERMEDKEIGNSYTTNHISTKTVRVDRDDRNSELAQLQAELELKLMAHTEMMCVNEEYPTN